MTLDIECVRDILVTVERCPIGEKLSLESLCERLPQYTKEIVWYACIKIQEGGYLDMETSVGIRLPLPAIVCIKDLTYSGHELLNTIRVDSNWNKTKGIVKKAGVFSIQSIAEIGGQVAAAALTAALQSHL